MCGFNNFLTKAIKHFNADVARQEQIHRTNHRTHLKVDPPLAFSSPMFISNMKLSLPSDELMELSSHSTRETTAAAFLPPYLLLSSLNSCSVRQAADLDSFKIIIA